MFNERENFYAREMGNEKVVETGAGEKIFVIAFQHMPGDSFPIFEIGNDLDVRH